MVDTKELCDSKGSVGGEAWGKEYAYALCLS